MLSLPLIPLFAFGLSLLPEVSAGHLPQRHVRLNRHHFTGMAPRDFESEIPDDLPQVPTYNISMPVDHFDPSNKTTYPNRFFVNDTHYQPGGPVIFYDFGEAGVDPVSLALQLSEYGGQTSSTVALAERLHGLLIGWEHRYYGYSNPVTMDTEAGAPVDGLDGYKYLTIEQSLQDVVHFANSFNATKLPRNKALNGSTANLDPYHTPWIFVGGSYPGSRAAWMRAKFPDIIYASWASSAPLQTQNDGSIYANPLMRALPSNCTSDIQAAIKYVDRVLSNGSSSEQLFVARAVTQSVNDDYGQPIDPEYATPFDVGSQLYFSLIFYGYYQYIGPTGSTQLICDAMESFNADEFLDAYYSARDEPASQTEAILENSADGKPPAKGLAATAKPHNAGLVAFAALTYGFNATNKEVSRLLDHYSEEVTISPAIDAASWNWQTVSEVGWFQGSNDSHPFRALSRFYNVSAVRDNYAEYAIVTAEQASQESTHKHDQGGAKIPKQLNDTYLLDVGGWNAKISNVMFTNGEFDPWRAFSVASQETGDGAPGRNVTRQVPACNAVSQGTDVFGVVYPGEVHASDFFLSLNKNGSDRNGHQRIGTSKKAKGQHPAEIGLELFLEAWKVWEPCFEKSRDDVRNGKGVDGKGSDATGQESAASGMTGGLCGGLLLFALFVGAGLLVV